MKICFLARPSFDVFSPELFKKLKKKDSSIEAVFITTNTKESNIVRGLLEGYDCYTIIETANYLKDNWDKFTTVQLSAYEKEFNCAPIWRYIYSDRFLIFRDYEYCVHVATGLFSLFDKIFSTQNVDYYYSECVATLQCYAAYLVGKKRNVKYVAQMPARGALDFKYYYFVNDEYQHNSRFRNDYKLRVYDCETISIAERFLAEFEEKGNRPPGMDTVRSKPKIDYLFVTAPFRYLLHRFDKYLNDPYSYMYYKSYNKLLSPITHYYKYKLSKKYYVEADYSKKYVFFPLHLQPEASTCVCAEKYEKQLFYIDSWAKSLPADTVLYVKEHYALLGNRELSFYKECNKYPNVFLINPWENSRKMIEYSVAVTTLTGTAGYEAMLMRKPVFISADCVYDNAPGVIKLDDIYGNYMSALQNWKQPSRDEIIKYLCESISSYEQGNAYAQNFKNLIEDNIDSLSESLYDYIYENEIKAGCL